jgi:thioredoxin-related protein
MRRPAFRLFAPLVLLLAPAACAQPSDAPAPPKRTASASAPRDSTRLTWHSSVEAALTAAEGSGKKVLVDVYAPWCPWCLRLQRDVYTDDAVVETVQRHFEIARVNGELEDDTVRFKGYTLSSRMLAGALGTQGYPTTAFLDAAGRKITHLPGFADAAEFNRVLRYVGTDAYRAQTYEAFTAADSARAAAPRVRQQ